MTNYNYRLVVTYLTDDKPSHKPIAIYISKEAEVLNIKNLVKNNFIIK